MFDFRESKGLGVSHFRFFGYLFMFMLAPLLFQLAAGEAATDAITDAAIAVKGAGADVASCVVSQATFLEMSGEAADVVARAVPQMCRKEIAAEKAAVDRSLRARGVTGTYDDSATYVKGAEDTALYVVVSLRAQRKNEEKKP